MKGGSETGTIGPPAAIGNAVVDALWHLGVRHVELPITRSRYGGRSGRRVTGGDAGGKAMMAGAEEAVAKISRDELVKLTLDICNIDSQGPNEAPVAEHVAGWLAAEQFKVRKIGLLPDRYNVLGKLPDGAAAAA